MTTTTTTPAPHEMTGKEYGFYIFSHFGGNQPAIDLLLNKLAGYQKAAKTGSTPGKAYYEPSSAYASIEKIERIIAGKIAEIQAGPSDAQIARYAIDGHCGRTINGERLPSHNVMVWDAMEAGKYVPDHVVAEVRGSYGGDPEFEALCRANTARRPEGE